MAPPDLSPRDAALWRVGRNLQCFQSIEAVLKSLLPTAKLSGTHQQIESQILKSKRAAKKATLGTLTDTYTEHVLSPQGQSEEPEVGPEVLFSLSMSVDAPPEVLKEMRAKWRRLTRERNQVVHSIFLAYDLDSNDGCVALSEHLDEQYERARVLLGQLEHQDKTRQLFASAFQQLHDSGELQRLLAEPPK